MGDWSEIFFNEHGIEISAEGFILGADTNAIEFHVLKEVDESEWSVEGSEKFLETVQAIVGDYGHMENRSEEFYYHVATTGRVVPGGQEGADAEVDFLRKLADLVVQGM